MADFKGSIIAEGLDDPTIINGFKVYRAQITKDGIPVDYEGHLGRWHIYDVECSRKEIDGLQRHVLRGWYAHFWKQEKITNDQGVNSAQSSSPFYSQLYRRQLELAASGAEEA